MTERTRTGLCYLKKDKTKKKKPIPSLQNKCLFRKASEIMLQLWREGVARGRSRKFRRTLWMYIASLERLTQTPLDRLVLLVTKTLNKYKKKKGGHGPPGPSSKSTLCSNTNFVHRCDNTPIVYNDYLLCSCSGQSQWFWPE